MRKYIEGHCDWDRIQEVLVDCWTGRGQQPCAVDGCHLLRKLHPVPYRRETALGELLESRKVVDLLPDREAGTLASWLEAHPEVHTVLRDRASAYSLGIRTGAPCAIQVADRFHLLVNLREAFCNSLSRHGRILKECFQAFHNPYWEAETLLDDNRNDVKALETGLAAPEDENIGLFVGNVSLEKQFKFQKAKELHQKGYSIKSIAEQLGAGRKTIST